MTRRPPPTPDYSLSSVLHELLEAGCEVMLGDGRPLEELGDDVGRYAYGEDFGEEEDVDG